jgi:hypothetical protein
VAVVAATGGTASASQSASAPMFFSANSSGLFLDLAGGSVVQANFTGHNTEQWSVPAVGATGRIRNFGVPADPCVTTDGTAGDQLYLAPCRPRLASYQRWQVIEEAPGVLFFNPHFGLVIDVYQGSTSPGSAIDAWYYTGQSNQWFTEWAG